MTTPLRIAVQIQPQHADYAQIRDAVLRAEEAGVSNCQDLWIGVSRDVLLAS
jgi:hypothetical protein